jgi:hypothetical protein
MRHEQPRQPTLLGRLGRVAALAAILAHLGSWAQAATLVEGLAGKWATRSGPALRMEWTPNGGGFGLRLTVPGGHEIGAAFVPRSGRPGLFFTERDEGWSMFGNEEADNPMLDGPLLWARATEDAVYVYRIEIDAKGGFVVERYACRPVGDGLDVGFQRRLPDGRTEESRMRLTRAPS